MDTVAVARAGQPWSEAKAMDPIERRAFLYCVARLNGLEINWATGRVLKPKGPSE